MTTSATFSLRRRGINLNILECKLHCIFSNLPPRLSINLNILECKSQITFTINR